MYYVFPSTDFLIDSLYFELKKKKKKKESQVPIRQHSFK